MIYYYYSLLLGLLGSFIGTSLHTIGTGSTSQSKIFWETKNKESAFFAYDHIISIQSGEDATTRSNQTALQLHQTADQIETLQQNPISHQRNYPSNQQHKRKLENMYQILKHKTVICQTVDLAKAIKIVQTLESGLDRFKEHSPYTIYKSC